MEVKKEKNSIFFAYLNTGDVFILNTDLHGLNGGWFATVSHTTPLYREKEECVPGAQEIADQVRNDGMGVWA